MDECRIPFTRHSDNLPEYSLKMESANPSLRNPLSMHTSFFCGHSGRSMNPTLSHLDMLVVLPYGTKKIRAGDVILFRMKNGKYIVHRVAEIISPREVLTKGDNNQDLDPWVVSQDHILGKVVAAWRGDRRRVVFGGWCGLGVSGALKIRIKLKKYFAYCFKPIFRSVTISIKSPEFITKRFKLSVVWFHSSSRYPMHLRCGSRTIGRYDLHLGAWVVPLQFRLLVNYSQLPEYKSR